jgi:hypothetical protein
MPGVTAYAVRSFDGDAIRFAVPVIVRRPLPAEIPRDVRGAAGAVALIIERIKQQAATVPAPNLLVRSCLQTGEVTPLSEILAHDRGKIGETRRSSLPRAPWMPWLPRPTGSWCSTGTWHPRSTAGYSGAGWQRRLSRWRGTCAEQGRPEPLSSPGSYERPGFNVLRNLLDLTVFT